MDDIIIYFNPSYLKFGPTYMEYIKDNGIWVKSEKNFFKAMQKPTAYVEDPDVYATSRNFIKIASFCKKDKKITYYNEYKDLKKLKKAIDDSKALIKIIFYKDSFFIHKYSSLYLTLNKFEKLIDIE